MSKTQWPKVTLMIGQMGPGTREGDGFMIQSGYGYCKHGCAGNKDLVTDYYSCEPYTHTRNHGGKPQRQPE